MEAGAGVRKKLMGLILIYYQNGVKWGYYKLETETFLALEKGLSIKEIWVQQIPGTESDLICKPSQYRSPQEINMILFMEAL